MTQHGWLVPLMTLVAGVTGSAALHHLVIGIRRPSERVHLTFAAMCAVAAAWALVGIPRYTTADVDTYVRAAVWRNTLGLGLGLLMAWLVAQYTRVAARPFLMGLTAAQGCLIVANLWLPWGLHFSGPPELMFSTLPWGERVTTAVGPTGTGNVLLQGFSFLDFLFCFWASGRAWRRGDRGLAAPVLVALAVLGGGVFNLYGGVLGSMPTMELAYLGLVLVMSLAVSNRVVEAARLQEALAESEQRLRTLVETAPEAVLLLDAGSGSALEANDNALTLLGIPRQRLAGLQPASHAPPTQGDGEASAAVFARRMEEALGGGRPVFRWVVRGRGDADVPCEARLVRLPGTSPALVRLSLTDLQTLEAAEARQADLEARLAQSQRLEALGKLTGGVAHDFNNYLTVVQGNLEMVLEGGALGEEDREILTDVLDAARRSGELTKRLLAFARRQPLAPRSVGLDALIRDLEALLARTLGESVRIVADVPAGMEPFEADPAQLETALLNLVVNARDAMPEGGVVRILARDVRLRAGEHTGPGELAAGDYVAISVVDTGHGMDAGTVRQAVDPFFTTKDAGRGTGLGLSMVYGFLVQSGGGLGIESAPGKGTTMTMFLPRRGTRPGP